jgi:hypothetical protein
MQTDKPTESLRKVVLKSRHNPESNLWCIIPSLVLSRAVLSVHVLREEVLVCVAPVALAALCPLFNVVVHVVVKLSRRQPRGAARTTLVEAALAGVAADGFAVLVRLFGRVAQGTGARRRQSLVRSVRDKVVDKVLDVVDVLRRARLEAAGEDVDAAVALDAVAVDAATAMRLGRLAADGAEAIAQLVFRSLS